MSCEITQGLSNMDYCGDLSAGIKNVYVKTYSSRDTYTLNSTNIVTGLTAYSGSPSYFSYETDSELSGFEVIPVKSEGGTVTFECKIDMEFAGINTTRKNILVNLIKQKTSLIVCDINDQHWYLPNMAKLDSGAFTFGKKAGDDNKITVSLKATVKDFYEIQLSAIPMA